MGNCCSCNRKKRDHEKHDIKVVFVKPGQKVLIIGKKKHRKCDHHSW